MKTLPRSIDNLITQLAQLPGIGPKTASRLVFFLLRNNSVDLQALGEALATFKENIQYCTECHNISEGELCEVCSDPRRDSSAIAVVEEPLDVLAMERAGFEGRYHVMGGRISPLEGIGPNELEIESLLNRLRNHPEVKEIIIATNPNVEGEATASYLIRALGEFSVRITRLARGLPMGGDLEYADELTLNRALEGRNEVTQ